MRGTWVPLWPVPRQPQANSPWVDPSQVLRIRVIFSSWVLFAFLRSLQRTALVGNTHYLTKSTPLAPGTTPLTLDGTTRVINVPRVEVTQGRQSCCFPPILIVWTLRLWFPCLLSWGREPAPNPRADGRSSQRSQLQNLSSKTLLIYNAIYKVRINKWGTHLLFFSCVCAPKKFKYYILKEIILNSPLLRCGLYIVSPSQEYRMERQGRGNFTAAKLGEHTETRWQWQGTVTEGASDTME